MILLRYAVSVRSLLIALRGSALIRAETKLGRDQCGARLRQLTIAPVRLSWPQLTTVAGVAPREGAGGPRWVRERSSVIRHHTHHDVLGVAALLDLH